MALFFLAVFILSGIVASLFEIMNDVKKMVKASSNKEKTYRDHKGVLRNSANGHSIIIGECDKLYDSWTGELISNPVKDKEDKEKEIDKTLNETKHRVFNNSTEEAINFHKYGHKIVYRDNNGVLYGKLNCNLGYQFWVNLTTGIMEETELSKKTDHTKIRKYHKKCISKKNVLKPRYEEDYTDPYTQEELKEENEEILAHLNNHNDNMRCRSDINSAQKFTPWWCYNPHYESDMDHLESRYQDNIIFFNERTTRASASLDKNREGWND